MDQEDTGLLIRDSEFNVAACSGMIKRDFGNMFGCLAKMWTKRCLTVNETEMPDLSQFTIEEGIQRFRKITVLE